MPFKKGSKIKKIRNLPGEEWRIIPYTDGKYWASNKARVKFDSDVAKRNVTYHKSNLLRISESKVKDYKRVTLYLKKRRIDCRLNRAVLMAFADVPDSHLLTVKHLDGNPLNNSPENLSWISRREMEELRKLDRLKALPEIKVRQPRVKVRSVYGLNRKTGEPIMRLSNLTDNEVADIRGYYAKGAAKAFLARAYGVSAYTIKNVLKKDYRNRTY